jgi:hypothetical protein
MPNNLYAWSRTWKLLTSLSERRQDTYNPYFATEVYALARGLTDAGHENLSQKPCLLLTGEGGLGKSTEANLAVYNLKAGGARANYVSMSGVEDREFLRIKLFRKSFFREWLNDNDEILHLFVDGLDESSKSLDFMGNLLLQEIEERVGEKNLSRLRLRVLCRPGTRSEKFEENLNTLYAQITPKEDGNRLDRYELQPLDSAQLRIAAESENLDPNDFLQWLHSWSIFGLATTPVLLKAVFKEYKNNQNLTSLDRIYHDACMLMCEDDPELGRPRNVDLEDRYRIASHVAMISLCAGCKHVSLHPYGDKPILRLPTVSKYDLTLAPPEPIGEQELAELFTSKHFTPEEPTRLLSWSQRLLQEYLCAQGLSSLSAQQIDGILFFSDGKVYPYFSSVAAFLAMRDERLLEELLSADPIILIDGAVDVGSNERRERLIESLFYDVAADNILAYQVRLSRRKGLLDHPNLERQLLSWISQESHIECRKLACDFAAICEVRTLQRELLDLALSAVEDLQLRVTAAQTLKSIGDAPTRQQLWSLAAENIEGDNEQELKAAALDACWPDAASAEEMFSVFSQKLQRVRIGGRYDTFIANRFVENLRDEDLFVALEWSRNSNLWLLDDYPFGELRRRILKRSWGLLERTDLELIVPFAQAVLPAIRKGRSTFGDTSCYSGEPREDLLGNNLPCRQMLLLTIIELPEYNSLQDSYNLMSSDQWPEQCIARQEDRFWLIEVAMQSTDSENRRKLACLINRFFKFEDFEMRYALVAAVDAVPELVEEFKPKSWYYVDPKHEEERLRRVALDEARDKQNSNYLYSENLLNEPNAPTTNSAESFLCWVIEVASNQQSSPSSGIWERLVSDFLNLRIGHPWEELQLSFKESWNQLNPTQIQFLLNSAIEHLRHASASMDSWSQLRGYVAFRTLQASDEGLLKTLNLYIWYRWAYIFIEAGKFVRGYSTVEEDPHSRLLSIAHRNVPEVLCKAAIKEIDQFLTSGGMSPGFKWLSFIWSAELQEALLVRLNNANSIDPTRQLVTALLENGGAAAQDSVLSVFMKPELSGDPILWKREVIAVELVKKCCTASWEILWPAMQNGKNLALAVVLRLGTLHYAAAIDLPSDQIVAWIIDMEYRLRSLLTDSPQPSGITKRSSDESVICFDSWRRNLISELTKRFAVAELVQIQSQISDSELRSAIVEAKRNCRESNVRNFTPYEIKLLLKDAKRRVITNEVTLLDAAIESLHRLQEKLQNGTPPAVYDLWTEIPARFFVPAEYKAFSQLLAPIPKGEIRISEYLARYLEQELGGEGVVVSREVEQENQRGYGIGDKTDIELVGNDPALSGNVKCVIEVKGCWEEDLFNVEHYLLNRYMSKGRYSAGLYIVGWFGCEAWQANRDLDESRSKKFRTNQKTALTLDEAREHLNDKAIRLSSHGRAIRCLVIDLSLSVRAINWPAGSPKLPGRLAESPTVSSIDTEVVSDII